LPSRWNGVNIPIPVGLGDARPAVDHAQLDPLAAVARRQQRRRSVGTSAARFAVTFAMTRSKSAGSAMTRYRSGGMLTRTACAWGLRPQSERAMISLRSAGRAVPVVEGGWTPSAPSR
jgi:hypothetical protein